MLCPLNLDVKKTVQGAMDTIISGGRLSVLQMADHHIERHSRTHILATLVMSIAYGRDISFLAYLTFLMTY